MTEQVLDKYTGLEVEGQEEDFVWLSLQLPLEERLHWGTIAATLGVSRSELIRQAMRFYIPIIIARMASKKSATELVQDLYGKKNLVRSVQGDI